MKPFKSISAAALAFTMVLAACTTQDDALNGTTHFTTDPDAVRINATVGEASPVTRSNPVGTAEEQAKFNVGDQIAVQAGTQTAVTYRYDGTAWTPATSGAYLKWASASMDFTAYYPVADGISLEAFALPTDQSTLDKLTAADYMTCTATSVAKADNVSLPLVRRTARVVIGSITFNDQFKGGYTVSDIKVSGNTTGYAGGNVQTGNVEVTAYTAAADSKRYALLTPTTADATATFLTLTVTKTADASTQTLTVKGIPALEAGKSYSYSLAVGKNMVQVGNVTVENWETGAVLGDATNGNEAEEVFVSADAATHTVTLLKAGALTTAAIATAIGTEGALKIAGSMNDADFTTLRDWAYKQITDNAAKKLVTLDLSAVNGLEALPKEAFSLHDDNDVYSSLSSLTSVTLPDAVTAIGDDAFMKCSSLTSINLGKVKTIGEYAFARCTLLTNIDLSAATSIGASGFRGCTSLGIINAPVLKDLNNSVFENCGTVSAVNLPEVTTCSTDDYTVAALSGLTVNGNIHLPKCTSLMKNMFFGTSVTGGLYLTTSANITMNNYAFYVAFSTAPTLYLHQNKKEGASGGAIPQVSGKGWGYVDSSSSILYFGWAAIKYVDDAGNEVTN